MTKRKSVIPPRKYQYDSLWCGTVLCFNGAINSAQPKRSSSQLWTRAKGLIFAFLRRAQPGFHPLECEPDISPAAAAEARKGSFHSGRRSRCGKRTRPVVCPGDTAPCSSGGRSEERRVGSEVWFERARL